VASYTTGAGERLSAVAVRIDLLAASRRYAEALDLLAGDVEAGVYVTQCRETLRASQDLVAIAFEMAETLVGTRPSLTFRLGNTGKMAVKGEVVSVENGRVTMRFGPFGHEAIPLQWLWHDEIINLAYGDTRMRWQGKLTVARFLLMEHEDEKAAKMLALATADAKWDAEALAVCQKVQRFFEAWPALRSGRAPLPVRVSLRKAPARAPESKSAASPSKKPPVVVLPAKPKEPEPPPKPVASTPREHRFVFRKWIGPHVDVGRKDGVRQAMPAGIMRTATFTSDGRWLAAAHTFGVDLWDAKTWSISRRLDGIDQAVLGTSLSGDGKRVAAFIEGRRVVVWDIESGEQHVIPVGEWRIGELLALNGTGSQVAVRGGDALRLWRVGAGQWTAGFGKRNKVSAVCFDLLRRRFVVGGQDGTISLWGEAGFALHGVLEGHEREVLGLAMGHSGRMLVSSDGHTVRLWDLESRQQTLCLRDPTYNRSDMVSSHPAASIACSHRAGLVAAAKGKGVRVWDAKSGHLVAEVAGTGVRRLSFSPDGRQLAAASHVASRSLRVLDPNSAGVERDLSHYGEGVIWTSFCPGRPSLLASRSWSETTLWNLSTGKKIHRLPVALMYGHPVFDAEGRQLILFKKEGCIQIWSPTTGKLVREAHLGMDLSYRCAAASPDGSLVACAGWSPTITALDLTTGRTLWQQTGHRKDLEALAFSPDGELLASVAGESRVRLWSARDGRCVRSLEGSARRSYWHLAFSADGRWLATTDACAVVVWEVQTGKVVHQSEFSRDIGYVQDVAFNPNGRELALSTGDGHSILLWDTKTWQRLASLTRHRTDVTSISFSEDGNLLASASWDGMIGVWERKLPRGSK